ncbi:MAG: insulinase family protein [Candidatus Muiribacteriota bacterium]
MEFERETLTHGFKLIKKEYVSELKSESLLFEHEKSGARLIKLKNKEDNRVFSIAFRTPPYDNTGLPHVLEHSVLCGSRKFNTKEPFVELIKGSLNTFLNAMTFSDKTMYPVASKNEKDFFNLMDVYLDAVLYPNIHENPMILMQEGWHYELENENEPLKYKGVVYNEMKGAFSSPERTMFSKIEQSLLPDTTYGYESGGDPDYIPELTQEKFRNFHKKYYHPSNSYIFLYGNGDTEKELKFINENYLKDFDRIKVDSNIEYQKSFDEVKNKKFFYPVSEGTPLKDKTFFGYAFSAGEATDTETYHALQIMKYMLFDNPASPLKNKLLEVEAGKDVFALSSEVKKPYISVIVKNSDEDKAELVKNTILNTLKELSENGIDRDLIKAAINKHEFSIREAEFGYPKGLIYNMIIMDSWLYEGDPVSHIKFSATLNNIRKKVENGYFEDLIKSFFLNNNHSVFLTLSPSTDMMREREEQMSKKLENIKNNMSAREIKEIVQETNKLKQRQQTPDSAEALSSIPMLKTDDIKKEAQPLPLKLYEEKDIELYHSDLFTNKISYLNLLFDLRVLNSEELKYAGLLAGILGKLSTENNNYRELAKKVDINTGGINFLNEVYTDSENTDKYKPVLRVKGKSLVENTQKLTELIEEILSSTDFNSLERFMEVIAEIKSRIEMSMMGRADMYARKRLFSYFSQSGKCVEIVDGLTNYMFISDIEKQLQENFGNIKSKLKEISKKLFNRKNMVFSYTGEKEDFENYKKSFLNFLNDSENTSPKLNKWHFDTSVQNEGLLSPAQVQFVAKGGNIKKYGVEVNGNMDVLKTAVRLDYLWNRVRVQGGAYGAFFTVESNGNVYSGSFRDPNLAETLEAIDGIPEYVKNFRVDDRELTKYIIGTISDLDRHHSPGAKGFLALKNKLTGITFNKRQKRREEVLSTQVSSLNKLSEGFEKVFSENIYTVFGNENKIKKNKSLFKKMLKIFN